VGLVLDTNVLILAERRAGDRTTTPDFSPWSAYGQVYISAASEARRIKRSAFVEATLAAMPILDFNLEAARVHARIKAGLQARGQTLGANDLVIAATALAGGHAVLTTDTDDFGRVPGLEVLAFPLAD
jgi:predicted nucleic acid-binding protein